MRFRFLRKIIDAKSNLNELSTELSIADLGSVDQLSYYVVFGAGTNGGSVQVESSPVSGFAGTWAPEGSAVAWSAASKVAKVSIAGTSAFSRARISVGITGGTVDVWVVANG